MVKLINLTKEKVRIFTEKERERESRERQKHRERKRKNLGINERRVVHYGISQLLESMCMSCRIEVQYAICLVKKTASFFISPLCCTNRQKSKSFYSLSPPLLLLKLPAHVIIHQGISSQLPFLFPLFFLPILFIYRPFFSNAFLSFFSPFYCRPLCNLKSFF